VPFWASWQEPGSAQITTYPRQQPSAVRKTDERRKQKRKRREARQSEEESKRRDELRRLKNLKREEIEQKLNVIREVAGAGAPDALLLDSLVEGDFDPAEYDSAMDKAFGSTYYEVGWCLGCLARGVIMDPEGSVV
jgi:protein KRI1